MDTSSVKKMIFKVVVLGDSGVGKTCLLNQYVKASFNEKHQATIGADFMTKDVEMRGEDGAVTMVTIQIWDTAGQERYSSTIGKYYYRGADACIIMFDVSRKAAFQNVIKWKNEFTIGANNYSNNNLIPIEDSMVYAIVANKIDLVADHDAETKEAKLFCESEEKEGRIIRFFEVSAKDRRGVDQSFSWIVHEVLKNNLEPRAGDQSVNSLDSRFEEQYHSSLVPGKFEYKEQDKSCHC